MAFAPVQPMKSVARRADDPDADLHELLTVEDVAALLKVSKSWVYEHTRRRGLSPAERLPHIKIGKYVRFEGHAVRAFLEKKRNVKQCDPLPINQ